MFLLLFGKGEQILKFFCRITKYRKLSDKVSEINEHKLFFKTLFFLCCILQVWAYQNYQKELRLYQVGNTSSRMITEVKQLGPQLAHGWVTIQV